MTQEVWAALVGAVVGVVIAMLAQHLGELLFGPCLELCIDPESQIDMHLTTATSPTGAEISDKDYWVRVRVANAGRHAAREVEIIVSNLMQWDDAASAFRQDPQFPMSLKWSNIGRSSLERLPSGIEKHCDLVHIPDPASVVVQGGTSGSCTAILEIEVHSNLRPGIPPGTGIRSVRSCLGSWATRQQTSTKVSTRRCSSHMTSSPCGQPAAMTEKRGRRSTGSICSFQTSDMKEPCESTKRDGSCTKFVTCSGTRRWGKPAPI